MKQIILVFLLLSGIARSQVVKDVYLTTQMTGVHDLGGGTFTNTWGFGYDSLGTISLPAPLLEFDLGDSVRINMINDSPESHTIHLHGLDVDQFNDGVPSTSFFVITGDTGKYKFRALNEGGYLYHCHVTTTQHLTMGMYGMIGVNAPGNLVHVGGPAYDKKYHFLASDLEVATNDAPLLAFPFHEIVPDHFMINGLAGSYLAGDSANIVFAGDGEDVLLRLGSMAYSKVIFNFPIGSNPMVHMSDGRVLPSAFSTSSLEVYPGERYSVLLSPDSGFVGQVEVEYYSMLSDQLVGTNLIAINRTDLGLTEPSLNGLSALQVFPNPTSGHVAIDIVEAEEVIQWFDDNGKLIAQRICKKGLNEFNMDFLRQGTYFVRSSRGAWQKVVVH